MEHIRRLLIAIICSVIALLAYAWVGRSLLGLIVPFLCGMLAGASMLALAVVIANRQTERMVRRLSTQLQEGSPYVGHLHPTRMVAGTDKKNVSMFVGEAEDVAKYATGRPI